jgi:hypothetical protein
MKEKLEKYSALTEQIKKLSQEADEIRDEVVNEIGHKEDGQTTHHFDEFALTLKGSLARTIDEDEWKSIRDEIPPDLHPVKYKIEIQAKQLFDLLESVPHLASVCSKITLSLDESAYKNLADIQPIVWKQVASCVTEKPRKVGFVLKKKKEGE